MWPVSLSWKQLILRSHTNSYPQNNTSWPKKWIPCENNHYKKLAGHYFWDVLMILQHSIVQLHWAWAQGLLWKALGGICKNRNNKAEESTTCNMPSSVWNIIHDPAVLVATAYIQSKALASRSTLVHISSILVRDWVRLSSGSWSMSCTFTFIQVVPPPVSSAYKHIRMGPKVLYYIRDQQHTEAIFEMKSWDWQLRNRLSFQFSLSH